MKASLGAASSSSDITTLILEAVKSKRVCELEDLVQVCSSCTWNQIFLEVDRLSRTGELRLIPKRAGVYAVSIPAHRPMRHQLAC